MAAPFLQALLKNLPTIISVGTGLFSLFRQVNANKQENSRVIQAFQLLRDHQDDLDRFLADPERQRQLMEGYSILLRRIQELQRDRRNGTSGWERRDRYRDEGYGFRQLPYHDRDDAYRTKGEFTDDFRRRDNFRGRDGYRDDFRGRDEYRDEFRGRENTRDELRRRGESSRQNRAEVGGKASKGKSKGAHPHKIKAQLVCDICKERYNSGNRRPILLPTCGHTFCHACLREESRRKHLRCPLCRSDPFMDVSSLPINRPILDLVNEYEGSDFDEDNEESGGACGSGDGGSFRNNTTNSGNNPNPRNNPSSGNNTPNSGNENPSCGNENPSCGNDNPSCGNDNPSCGSGDSGWGDSSTFTMMSFEEQIQLAIMWSREEMRRSGKSESRSSNPFDFLDQAERENEELARAMSLSLMEAQNNDQNSRSEDEACCRSHCTEMNDDEEEEEEHIKLAIIMSLETSINEGQEGGTECGASQNGERPGKVAFLARQAELAEEEFQQALILSREEYQLAQEPRFPSAARVDEVVQCGANTVEEQWRRRDREREELNKERERLRKEKEDLEREKEEWRKQATKQRSKDKAKQTLAGLGCFVEDHSKGKKSDGKGMENDDGKGMENDDDGSCSCDDCFQDNDCSTDDDDDVCCGKVKKIDDKASCTESEEECGVDNDKLCRSNSDKPAAEGKKEEEEEDTASSRFLLQEEEKERRKRKKREWRKKKEEEQIQLAMALSLSLHEAEAVKAE